MRGNFNNGNPTSPESVLLGRIQQELTSLSEQQHVMARRMNMLRQARTQLHLGRSAPAVNAILAEARLDLEDPRLDLQDP